MKKANGDFYEQIEHTLQVLGFAEDIMKGEEVEEEKRELISIIAILHDIGIKEALKKYGSAAAPYQEKEGAVIAREILEAVGYPKEDTERVCYIVGYHHTASKIDGLDFQIQWEADLLVNLQNMEIKNDKEKLSKVIEENFKTATGKKLAEHLFLVE